MLVSESLQNKGHAVCVIATHHSQYTFAANSTMVTARWLVAFAFLAEPALTALQQYAEPFHGTLPKVN